MPKKINPSDYARNLPECGDTIRSAARDIQARRVAADKALADAQAAHKREQEEIRAAESALRERIREHWTAAEIAQAIELTDRAEAR